MDTKLLLNAKVAEIMNKDVISVDPKCPLEKVKIIFDDHSIHHIPVVDEEGLLRGIISKSDLFLLLDWGTKYGLEASDKKNEFLLRSNLASDIMEKNVVSVNTNDIVQKCVDIFKENYFRAMPVIDENKKFVGLITTYDLMIEAFK